MDRQKLLYHLAILSIFIFPLFSEAQNTLTLTTTSTTNTLSDNDVLGCPSCGDIQSQTDPFPDTSTPLFKGDVDGTLLPDAIADGLPPDNQFGVGIPSGSSSFPLSTSIPFSLGTFINSDNTFSSTPVGGGQNSNQITQNIQQITPGGTPTGPTTSIDQDFSILFSVQSLTDPDGSLVGAATGTFTQILDGVETSGTVQFDANGFSGTNLHEGFVSDGSFFN